MTAACRRAAWRAATPGPHPMSTTRSPGASRTDRPEAGVVVAADRHGRGGEESGDAGEGGVVVVVVGDGTSVVMASTLTLEPEFKSSIRMQESLLPIGEVAARAGVATSTIRYYERRGCSAADAGRRVNAATHPTRCAGSCSSACSRTPDSRSTRSTACSTPRTSRSGRRSRRCRLDALDEQIAQLQHARAAPRRRVLLCRYDHPATDCRIMGAEIDRRLEATEARRTPLVTRPGS